METSETFLCKEGLVTTSYDGADRVKVSQVRIRQAWTPGDWFCAIVISSVCVWLLLEVLPAFFDGRVAQVVGK